MSLLKIRFVLKPINLYGVLSYVVKNNRIKLHSIIMTSISNSSHKTLGLLT